MNREMKPGIVQNITEKSNGSCFISFLDYVLF